jgi:arylsulfatase
MWWSRRAAPKECCWPREGAPVRGQLYINRKLVGSVDMPYSILFMFGTQGLSCGYDAGDPAAPEEYSGEFRFTGKIKRVTIDLSGELIADTEAEMKIAMRRQ